MGGAVLKLRADGVAWREIEGETLLLDLRTSTYLAVNPSATVLWRQLEVGTTRDELVAALAREYELDDELAGADVDDFLADCRARDLIEEVEGG
jgi:hypothetical protein